MPEDKFGKEIHSADKILFAKDNEILAGWIMCLHPASDKTTFTGEDGLYYYRPANELVVIGK